jgi:protein-L-isoaspartate(D-aspartate) O-methyltransferase
MVEAQLAARGIVDRRVLNVMRAVPRHLFVHPDLAAQAYDDAPLPIPASQTISQPYIVAFMTEALRLGGAERVLEVGTGSGYQTAVLCALAACVYTLEYVPALAAAAGDLLARTGITNVALHVGDGGLGLPDMAPFDAIIVTAAAPAVPAPLRAQLAPDGGRLVIPVGTPDKQDLLRVTRHGERWRIEKLLPVRFVLLRGRCGFAPDKADV